MNRNSFGMPNERILATLRTLPIQEGGEMGFHEFHIHVDMKQLAQSADKRALFYHTISVHLASAIASTGVPKDFWFIHFSPKAQLMFDLPESVPFDGGLFR